MFGDMGVFTKVELEARTEVKWETYTKKIQIEGRVLGDLAMNHIVPIASKYEAQLLDKVYKMHQIGGLNASSDIAADQEDSGPYGLDPETHRRDDRRPQGCQPDRGPA